MYKVIYKQLCCNPSGSNQEYRSLHSQVVWYKKWFETAHDKVNGSLQDWAQPKKYISSGLKQTKPYKGPV